MGPMFCGKTHSLLLTAARARARVGGAGGPLRIVALRSTVDTRSSGSAAGSGPGSSLGSAGSIVSRTGLSLAADARVASLCGAGGAAAPAPGHLYLVDEAQFLPPGDLQAYWAAVEAAGGSLAVAGLDLDFARRPFGGVLALARDALSGSSPCRIERLSARCTHSRGGACGAPALFSQRLRRGAACAEGVVAVGGAELYQPACARHHAVEPIDRAAWFAAES